MKSGMVTHGAAHRGALGSVLGGVMSFCCSHVVTTTSTGRIKYGSGWPRLTAKLLSSGMSEVGRGSQFSSHPAARTYAATGQ